MRKRIPSYRLHKATGQAAVTIDGRHIYLGKHDTPASREKYNRLVAEWLTRVDPLPPPIECRGSLTVAQLVAYFWKHAREYYPAEDGLSSEAKAYREALNPLLKLYARAEASNFGPVALKAVRGEMIRIGWTRKNVNRQVLRLKAVFKWAASEELLPVEVYTGLQTVAGLRAGRSDARESAPVRPVLEETVDATLPHLPPTIATMVRLQLLTGARPGEICALRAENIERTGDMWIYRPTRHKTAHHGCERSILFGPKAQAVLRDVLKSISHGFLFCPSASERMRAAERRKGRRSPMTPSQARRSIFATRRRRSRPPGEHYDVTSYRRAITRACEIAFKMPATLKEPLSEAAIAADTPEAKIERRAKRKAWRAINTWSPHQLRHTAATQLRKAYGLEAAQVVLGHRTLTATQVYAERNLELAKQVMKELA